MATNPYAALYQQELAKGTPAPTASAPATPADPSLASRIGHGALDLYTGAAKGVAHTFGNMGNAITRPFVSPDFAKSQDSYLDTTTEPKNTAERVGQGVEQAGEFLVPGGAEEGLVAKAPAALRGIARIGAAALSSGLVNKAQGGTFKSGAEMGGAGGAVGEGLKLAAPALAESGLGIGKADRAFSKTPGSAILNDTRGIRPETIERTGQERLNELTPQLESKAQGSRALFDLQPARDVIAEGQAKAKLNNASTLHGQLNQQAEGLSRQFDTGQPIPRFVTPEEGLNLKRGFSTENLGRWNPETHGDTIATGRRAYGALDSELDRTVPEAAGLNQRISSLIPVVRRAESVSRNAPTVTRTLGRFGAHTGALMGAGYGASMGAHSGGLPGAIAGGMTGLLAPELIASPEGRLAAARLFNRPQWLRPVTGSMLAGSREAEK